MLLIILLLGGIVELIFIMMYLAKREPRGEPEPGPGPTPEPVPGPTPEPQRAQVPEINLKKLKFEPANKNPTHMPGIREGYVFSSVKNGSNVNILLIGDTNGGKTTAILNYDTN